MNRPPKDASDAELLAWLVTLGAKGQAAPISLTAADGRLNVPGDPARAQRNLEQRPLPRDLPRIGR